jgi:hypothetical protein
MINTPEATMHRDPVNHRTWVMRKECGMQFRANIVEPGGIVPLHLHSYDHVAAIHGSFEMTVTDTAGVTETRLAHKKETILAGYLHSFRFLDTEGVGEVLCFWPIQGEE